jgi:hypothetical protein
MLDAADDLQAAVLELGDRNVHLRIINGHFDGSKARENVVP